MVGWRRPDKEERVYHESFEIVVQRRAAIKNMDMVQFVVNRARAYSPWQSRNWDLVVVVFFVLPGDPLQPSISIETGYLPPLHCDLDEQYCLDQLLYFCRFSIRKCRFRYWKRNAKY